MKTVKLSKCTTIAMVSGGEKTHPRVVHNGKVKQWVGFGWIEISTATKKDLILYPTAV